MKKIVILSEIPKIKNEELYGFTLYFHYNKNIKSIISLINFYSDSCYVFIFENFSLKTDEFMKLDNWDIEKFETFIK